MVTDTYIKDVSLHFIWNKEYIFEKKRSSIMIENRNNNIHSKNYQKLQTDIRS